MILRALYSVLGVGLVCGALSAGDARAGTVLIFGQTDTTQLGFTATQSGTNTVLTATDIAVTITNVAGSTANLSAYFSLVATNISTASIDGSGHITQDFQGSFSIYSGTGKTGTNYLSGTFQDTVFGAGTALTLAASSAGGSSYLNFTSNYAPILGHLAPPTGMSLALTDVTPVASITNTTLSSFVSNVGGTFSAVPEPSSVGMLGCGLGGISLAWLRFRRKRA